MAVAKRELKLLAFGDSLTEGKSPRALEVSHHPYTLKLLSLISKVANSTVVNQGVSGEQVLVTMHARLDSFLDDEESRGIRYDWILLMAGINDIGMGATGEAVMLGLEKMYVRISRHNSRLLAMTTMSLSASDKPFYAAAEEERQKLNKLIRHWISSAAAIKSDGRGRVLVDMDKLILFTNTTTLFSPDGLHLSPEGYDRMGQEIYNGLSPFL